MSVTKAAKALAVAAAFGAIALLSTPMAEAGSVRVGAGGAFNMNVTSIKEARFERVIQQEYDYSCGSAAVATLLTYHYDRPTSEREVFQAMYEVGDQEAIRRYGFSLLDMRNYLESIGLQADGFEMGLEDLAEIGVPAITLVDTDGYMHFVVVKGVDDGRVLVGDPALGLNLMTVSQFEQIWEGIAFLVRDEVQIARANFNTVEEWNLQPDTPYGSALSRHGLATFSLLFRGQNEF